jgi:hypothetical protein
MFKMLDSSGLGHVPVAGSCKHGNEPLSSQECLRSTELVPIVQKAEWLWKEKILTLERL